DDQSKKRLSSRRACPAERLFSHPVMHLHGICFFSLVVPNRVSLEVKLHLKLKASSRSKIRCTLKNGEPAERCGEPSFVKNGSSFRRFASRFFVLGQAHLV
ncbi:hypothetical protein, partial [Mesotoga sp. Brook.08.YT.4.2.5.1]|uniref:hypothetical protein n=1 Tax=Mesotoga sp. Brook.08.YT.4.2.5.1 TaxID=1421001 RepID=UPI001CA4FA09